MSELYLERPQDYLKLELSLRKERRPAYSMRAFARDLQMSPTSLADFLNGRSGLSVERARSIAKALKWSDERRAHFWDLVVAAYSPDADQKERAKRQATLRVSQLKSRISVDSFRFISDWQHYALLTWLQMRPNGETAGRLAEVFELERTVVDDALERLARLELARQENEVWTALKNSVHSGDEAPSDAIRNFHQQILALATKAIQEKDMSERESFSAVYSIEASHLPKMRREIREAVLGILTEYSKNSIDDSVQVLTLQMFTLAETSEEGMPS